MSVGIRTNLLLLRSNILQKERMSPFKQDNIEITKGRYLAISFMYLFSYTQCSLIPFLIQNLFIECLQSSMPWMGWSKEQ